MSKLICRRDKHRQSIEQNKIFIYLTKLYNKKKKELPNRFKVIRKKKLVMERKSLKVEQ